MQFIVEDGTGLSNSSSYSSVEAADDYATFWDNQFWLNLTENEKQINLIKATQYLDINLDYPSSILKQTQALEYPRKIFTDKSGRDVEGIPSKLEEATIRLAIILAKDFNPSKQTKILTSQSYGTSSETYLGSYIEGESEDMLELNNILKQLAKFGYAFKGIKQIDVVRG